MSSGLATWCSILWIEVHRPTSTTRHLGDGDGAWDRHGPILLSRPAWRAGLENGRLGRSFGENHNETRGHLVGQCFVLPAWAIKSRAARPCDSMPAARMCWLNCNLRQQVVGHGAAC